jgi:hypothetical protein
VASFPPPRTPSPLPSPPSSPLPQLESAAEDDIAAIPPTPTTTSAIARAALVLDFAFFALLGVIAMLFPLSFLGLVRAQSNMFGWAGPSPAVASDSLLGVVQALGALLCALALLPLNIVFNPSHACAYGQFRFATGLNLLAAVLVPGGWTGKERTLLHPFAATSSRTTYNNMIPVAIHALIVGATVLATANPSSSPIATIRNLPLVVWNNLAKYGFVSRGTDTTNAPTTTTTTRTRANTPHQN